jgi:hypothetical protein
MRHEANEPVRRHSPGYRTFTAELLYRLYERFLRITEFDHAPKVDVATKKECMHKLPGRIKIATREDQSNKRSRHARQRVGVEQGWG